METNNIKDLLRNLLKEEISNETTILFAASPGNGGDALISLAAYELLADLKVKFIEIDITRNNYNLSGETVVFGGGGGLIPLYKAATDFLQAANNSAKKVIVLPQTVRGLEAFLTSLKPEFHLFTRDRESYTHAAQQAGKAKVFLSDDLAFRLDVNAILVNKPSTFEYLLSRLNSSKYDFKVALLQTLKWQILYFSTKFRNKIRKCHTLMAIRKDSESTVTPPPQQRNIDISSKLENNDMSSLGARITTYRMLKFIKLHNLIITNRLHVGIAAHLLDIETLLLDNSYGKISAIFKHSMGCSRKVKMINAKEFIRELHERKH